MTDRQSNEDDLERFADIMVEKLSDQLKTSAEALDEIKKQTAKIPAIEERLEVIENNVKAIKAVVTTTNKDLRMLDGRVTKLESVI